MEWDVGLYLIGNGEDSRVYGLGVTSLPKKEKPSERISKFSVPGRSGYLHISDDSFDNIDKTFGFICEAVDIEKAAEWLRGLTTISYSSEPDRLYKVATPPDVKTKQNHPTLCEFTQSIECFPLASEIEPSVFDVVNGMIIRNPSKIKAYPSFTAYGSGTIAVTIGLQTVTITGVSTSVTVAGGEDLICYDASGRADNRMTLSPASAVGYPIIAGETDVALSFTGASRVEFRPNWRFV